MQLRRWLLPSTMKTSWKPILASATLALAGILPVSPLVAQGVTEREVVVVQTAGFTGAVAGSVGEMTGGRACTSLRSTPQAASTAARSR